MTTPETASLEDLLNHVVAAYQQATTVPSGSIVGDTYVNGDGTPCIRLRPSVSYDPDSPKNFGDFFNGSGASKSHSMSKAEAFAWFARANLRYSCSTNVAKISRFLIPILKKRGITSLFSKTLGRKVHLGAFEIVEIEFTPQHQHAIELMTILGPRVEVVEATTASPIGPACCQHSVLVCRKTGTILDPSMGQFTGTMAPYVFRNMDELKVVLPGNIIHFFPCPPDAVKRQISRDNQMANISRYFPPNAFAHRVLENMMMKNKTHCCKCYGMASSRSITLKRCSRCKQASYCSKECQVMDWTGGHKSDCHQVSDHS